MYDINNIIISTSKIARGIRRCAELVAKDAWHVGDKYQIQICPGAIINVNVDAAVDPKYKAVVEYTIDFDDNIITVAIYRILQEYCQSTWNGEYEEIMPENWYKYDFIEA